MPQSYTKKKGNRLFPDQKKYLFNIDTLYINIDSHYYNEVMDLGLRDLLIEGREHYSDFSEPLVLPLTVPEYENELLFEVHGAQPPAYQYSIRNESYAFYFAKTRRDNMTPIKIQINQFVLWEKGVLKAYDEAKTILKCLGFLPTGAKLNRVDFAVHSDQWKWNVKDFTSFNYPRNFKDDNKPDFIKLDPITLDFETVYFGDRSRLLLRIYNKSAEIEHSKKYYFYEIYNKYEMDTTNVWNIEFQVNRPYLKGLKEETEDSLLRSVYDDFDFALENDGLSRLWSHLMDKFNHPSAHWTLLSKGEKDKFTKMENYNIKYKQDLDSNFDREVAQIAGRLMTGVINDSDYSLDHAIEKFKERLKEQEQANKRKNWLQLVEEKKKKIANNDINKTIKNYSEETNIDKEQDVNIYNYKRLQYEIKKDMLAPMSKK